MNTGTKSPENTRIMLVDDDEDFRDILARSFQRLGYQVLTASGGNDALEMIKAQPIDVIISDVRMPGGDGVQLLDRVKELRPETPIILLMSGFTDLTTEEAYNKGAEALFSKPFDKKVIQETIERLMTPSQERWARSTDRVDVEFSIQLQFQGLTEAMASKVVSLGRGGMFVTLGGSKLPNSNDAVSFKIAFEGSESSLNGTGVVRWVRTKDSAQMPTGCGIEFIFLGENERQRVIEIVNSSRPKAFIPNQ